MITQRVYFEYSCMVTQNLIDAILTLTSDQQEFLLEFVTFLKQLKQGVPPAFASAVDKFIEQHRQLLRGLAQFHDVSEAGEAGGTSGVRFDSGQVYRAASGITAPLFAEAYYPTVDDVLAAHARLIAKFGGSLGIRDYGALEHAVARPQDGYYADLIEAAATLWESLSQNHPFVDGNRRAAITATAAFLKVNGYRLAFNDLDESSFLIDLYQSGSMRFATAPEWEAIRNNLDPDRPPWEKVETWLRQHALPEDGFTEIP